MNIAPFCSLPAARSTLRTPIVPDPTIAQTNQNILPLPEGMHYAAYRAAWEATLKQRPADLDRRERRFLYYRRYNWERAARVEGAYQMSDALRQALGAIDAPQRWVVLTEDWCVDSAYSLPIIAAAAEIQPLITLRILPRDAHPEVMDRYLTSGARSIPKLIVFGAEGEECFRWGPRPAPAHRLRQRLKDEGHAVADISRQLIEWYDAGGWHLVDTELADRLAQSPCIGPSSSFE